MNYHRIKCVTNNQQLIGQLPVNQLNQLEIVLDPCWDNGPPPPKRPMARCEHHVTKLYKNGVN